MGLVAPAFLVIGAAAVWQLGPSAGGTTPGSTAQARLTDQVSQSQQGAASPVPIQTADRPTAGWRWRYGPTMPRGVQAALLRTEAAAAERLRAHRAGAATAARAKSATKRPQHKAVAVAHTFSCSGSTPSGMLPANYGPIVTFLAGHGYTPVAAAGIAGNIFRESMGNPESVGTGGGGLIGWTPLPAGFVTGNVGRDLRTQLTALLAYNRQWAQYIPALNAAKTATQAADIYMNDFERPGLPAAYDREGAANAVARACKIAGLSAVGRCNTADTGTDT